MRFLGNLIWFFLAGFWSWLIWTLVGLLFCATVVGIPFGLQFFKLASLGLFPFGKNIKTTSAGTGSFLLNLLWIVCFGWELAIYHLVIATVLALSIIGFPFAIQALKLAQLALFPFGARLD